MDSKTEHDPLIVIVGETASGKSALALELAQRFNGEIICADSWTVYRGFDIGTAKPTTADQTLITHHLVDIVDPNDGFSAAEFKRLAQTSINKITQNGKVPFLAGGTGLYIDSILYDYEFLPPPSPSQRNILNGLSLPELLRMTDSMGLDTETIDRNNRRRIIRLIENNGRKPTKKSLRKNTLVLGLKIPSEELTKRIKRRTDTMLASGLEQEVKRLADEYGWDVEPMKGIGYKEWKSYFDGAESLSETMDKIIGSTGGLVKKQRTWFKRNKSIHWVVNQGQIVDLVTTFLNKQ